jgi:hypothetical protein
MKDSPRLRPAEISKHAVQFYEDDRFLCEILADFSRDGLERGEAVIVVATAAHRGEVERRLTERGMEVGRLQESGQLVLLDARQTLDTLRLGGTLDAELFVSNLGALVAAASLGWKRDVRVYGEMVDLLWQEGNHDGAIRLEETWNAFAKTTSTRVLCGYSMDNFDGEGDSAEIARICEVHTDVQRAESHREGHQARARGRK